MSLATELRSPVARLLPARAGARAVRRRLLVGPSLVLLFSLGVAAGCGESLDDLVAQLDPCGGVSTSGRCVGDGVERCAIATGSLRPEVVRYACPADHACFDDGQGPTCRLTTECSSGALECRGDSVASCEGGAWRVQPCERGCFGIEGFASCRPDLPTTLYSGHLQFDFRVPNAGHTDWSPNIQRARAVGVLIVSHRGDEIIDVAVTSSDEADRGGFTVRVVPQHLAGDDDLLTAMLVAFTPDGRLNFIVADPRLTPGSHSPFTEAMDPRPWFWSWRAADIPNGDVLIRESVGSGAVLQFYFLNLVHRALAIFLGPSQDAPLVVWLGPGVDWTCGACFAPQPTQVSGSTLQNQIWIGGGPDEAFWGMAVALHELGHWVMSTYGALPGEGGPHFMGIPTHPGQAWAEGFATWFSSMVRQSPLYFDKQRGAFFWLDLRARRYSPDRPWLRPRAAWGLDQMMDENEVASMLLDLVDRIGVDAMVRGLASTRMTRPPFARGYVRRVWDGVDDNGLALPYADTNQSAPYLADFLDALMCEHGVAGNVVDAVTEPWERYPYPSHAPLCSAGRFPIEVRWASPESAALRAALGGPLTLVIRRHIHLEEDLHVALRLPPTARLLEGPADHTLPAGAAPGEERLRWVVAGDARGLAVDLQTGGEGWGYHARVPLLRPAVAPIERRGPSLRLGALDLGPTILLSAPDDEGDDAPPLSLTPLPELPTKLTP